MTNPRPRPPAPPDPETQRRITALEQELARLRAGTGGAPTVEDFHGALTRISQLEADAKSRGEAPPPEPPPIVDISGLSARLEATEQAVARLQATGPTTADLTALAARITEATAREPANSPTPVPEAPPVDLGPLDARLQAVEQQTARTAAQGPQDADLKALAGRVTAIEETAKTAPRTDAEERRATVEQLAALNEKVTAALAVAGQVAGFQQIVDALARDVATLKVSGDPAPGGVTVEAHRELSGKVDGLHDILNGDPTLATAKNRTGFQVGDAAISDVAATKLTGDVAAARITANLPTAFNATTGYDFAKMTVGAVTNAQLGVDAVDNAQIAALAVHNAEINDFALSKGTGHLTLLAGQNIGFYGTTPVTQRSRGHDLSNLVTAGGTANQVDDFTDLVTYANDAGAIRNAIYRLTQVLKDLNDGLRATGMFS